MQYLLLAVSDEAAWQNLSAPERERGVAEFGAYARSLQEAGAFVHAFRPHPSTATTTIRVRDGVTDASAGPVHDGTVQVAGVYVIEAPDADAARSWAARNPAARFGAVEVRPLVAPPVPAAAAAR